MFHFINQIPETFWDKFLHITNYTWEMIVSLSLELHPETSKKY